MVFVGSQGSDVQVVLGNVLEGSELRCIFGFNSVQRVSGIRTGMEMKGGSRVERYIFLNVL
jgi:hypothetical protein